MTAAPRKPVIVTTSWDDGHRLEAASFASTGLQDRDYFQSHSTRPSVSNKHDDRLIVSLQKG